MYRDVVFWSGISLVSRFNIQAERQISTRPMGAYQVAWWLRKHRFQCQVIEYIQLMTADELVAMTIPFITDKTICIGISQTFLPFTTQMPENMIRALWRLKVKFPKLKFVMGGQYEPASLEQKFPIDQYFAGYGEDTFLPWLQQKKQGVAFPNAKFDIKELQHRFIADDVIMPGEALPIELGRGCIFSCKFCGYSNIGKEKGSYLRHHSHLLDEMKYNKDMFGTDMYMFLDDTTNEDYDKVRRFSTFEQDLGFPINWVGYLRADLIWAKPETAEWLQQSGLVSPHFGIESFHPKASQNIGKGWSGKKGKDWLPKLYHDIWNEKLNLRMGFIVGLPYEPIKTIYDTIQWFNKDPIGNIFFSALSLHPEPPWREGTEDKRSVFSKDAGKLGFTFEDGVSSEGMYMWKSPWTTAAECMRIAELGINSTRRSCKVASWQLAAARNLGYTMEESLNMKGRDPLDKDDVRLKKLKQTYLTQFADHFDLPHIRPKQGEPIIIPGEGETALDYAKYICPTSDTTY